MENQAAAAARLVPGFGFRPTDEELVVYYLRRKVCRIPFRSEAIAEVDVYKFEPWELQAFCNVNTGEQEWYFFTRLEKKFATGSRLNRTTEKGYWKATGKDRTVLHDLKIVGMKKILIYYTGQKNDWRKTNWIMHEYRLVEEDQLENAGVEQKDSVMLCRIFLRNNESGGEEDWENDADIMVPCGDEDSQGASSSRKKPKLMFGVFPGNICGLEASSSTATHDATAAAAALTEFSEPAGLLNFSLSVQPEETHAPNADADLGSSSLEKSVPPGYQKFIADLEEDRKKLKVTVMESEAKISSLKAKNEQLTEELRRLRSLVLKD